MASEGRKKLWQKSVSAMERLDLPDDLAPGVAHMELVGNRDFYMERHGGVLAYSTETVDINGGNVMVRVSGSELQLVAMTTEELRIIGQIDKVELMG